MESKNLVICDPETKFASAFAQYLTRQKELAVRVRTCSDLSYVLAIQEKEKIDFLFISSEYPEDSRKQVKAGMVFVIAPEREVALENREVPIYKYQPGDQILAEMIRQCSMSGDEKQIFLKIGKTTYAIRLGRKLAKEANVLYLGMETYGGEGGHFPEGTQTLADVLYYARQEQSNIGTVLTTIVRHSENLDYIVPMPVSEDIKEIDSEEWIRLIQKIIEQSIYEIVILDMDEGVRDIYRVLRICNEIHMLTIDEPVAEAKVAQFEAELELLGYEDVRRKIIRKEQRT